MRDASGQPVRTGFICEVCLRFTVTAVEGIFSNPAVGSAQRFCDHACRQAAYRRRKAGVPEGTPLQRRGGRGRHLKPAGEVVTTPEN
jgi:hypothetical protein